MMNTDDLRSAAEKLHLPEEAKNRIAAKCSEICTEKNNDNSSYTDYVMPVELYKPRRFAKFAGIAAAAVLICGISCFTLNKMSKFSTTDKTPAARTELSDTRYVSPTIGTVSTVRDSPIGKFLSYDYNHNVGEVNLSEGQRKKIGDLFSGLTCTEIEYSQFTDDHISLQTFESEGPNSLTMLGDVVHATWTYYNPDTLETGNYHITKCYRLSKDISEDIRKILDTRFLFMFDNTCYLPDGRCIDKEGADEIRDLLNSLNYTSVTEEAAQFHDESECINLDCKNLINEYDNSYYRLSIYNNTFRCRMITKADFGIAPIDLKLTADSENVQIKIAEILKKHTLDSNVIFSFFMDNIRNTEKYRINYEGSEPDLSAKQVRQLNKILDEMTLELDEKFIPDQTINMSYINRTFPSDSYAFYISQDHIMLESRWFKTNIPDLCEKTMEILKMYD